MLKSIEIKNYALIQDLFIDFNKGLNIITGETGAGKTILLDALGLIMGKRADSKVLFDANKKCIVEAKFNLNPEKFKNFFDENELDFDTELVIRREIANTGKSRAFINDTPTTLDVLQELTELLIDLHQQFDTFAMFKNKFQIEAIDAIANNNEKVNIFRDAYQEMKSNEKLLASLIEKSRNINKEFDFVNFQYNELSEARLVRDEKIELENKLEKLSSAEDIKRIALMTNNKIEATDNSIIDQLNSMAREYSHIANIDPKFQDIYSRLISTIEELKDIAHESEAIAEETEADPATLEALNERLNLILKLEKKHGVNDVNDLIDLTEKLKDQLNSFSNNESNIEELKIKIAQQRDQLLKQATLLSTNRKNAIPEFEKKINDLLVLLAMPNAKLKVDIKQDNEININGIDQINFLFATNKGSEFLPLKDIASGGELSRLTLCIKSVLTEKMQLATMIFDEIDTGVSGQVASKMGSILKTMAKNHQMISITHSPQIAAKADQHYWVYKEDIDKRTVSKIKVLSQEERITEVAKMLSGSKPGKAAIENAMELMKEI